MQVYKIGKDFDKPIKIEDKATSVSHEHATITITDDGTWILQDNNSSNGTFIEEDGTFVRCSKVRITPSTWIRLGEMGPRGLCFIARRILSPNDYRKDFAEIESINQEYEACKTKLEEKRRLVKYLTPLLMIFGLLISFAPVIRDNGLAVRASFMLPGFLSPFIQDMMLMRLERKIRRLQEKLICPKCRRKLSPHEIDNHTCSICKIY